MSREGRSSSLGPARSRSPAASDDEQVAARASESAQRRSAASARSRRSRSAAPGARRPAGRLVAHLDEPELRDVARDRRLHGVEALRRAAPRRPPPASRASARRRAGGSRPGGRTCAHADSTSSRISSPCRARRRRTSAVASAAGRLAGGADEQPRRRAAAATTCAGAGGRARRASSSPRRAPRTPGSARGRASVAPCARTSASSSSSSVSQTATAAAHATGLPPNVLAWSPGHEAPRPCRRRAGADRQPVRQALRERHARRGARRAAPTRRTCPCGRRPSAPRRGRAARRARRRARGRLASELGASSGMNAALAQHRLEQDAAGLGPTAASSDATSFGCAKRDAGEQRLERGALRGLAGDRERAAACGRGTSPRARRRRACPVALRAYLSAASIASAPELQKNACAPPKRVGELRRRAAAIGSVQ